MNRTTIAVDLAKSIFQVAVADADWRVVGRQRLSRSQLLRFFAEQQTCLVVMEACGTAHFWGRWLNSLGFTVRLLPPQYVRAFVRRNKTDRGDQRLESSLAKAEHALAPDGDFAGLLEENLKRLGDSQPL
jgi:transposase